MDIKIYGVKGNRNIPYYWLVYQGEIYTYFVEANSVYRSTYTITLLENLRQDFTLEFIENFQYNDIVEVFKNLYYKSSINSTI